MTSLNSPRVMDGPLSVNDAALLRQAVYGQKEQEKASMLDRLFAFWFQRLVYPQIWEDPVIDMQAMGSLAGKHVITISSGGCNALSYLTDSPAKVSVVDLNHAHCALINLKIAAVCALDSHADFYAFFGHADRRSNAALYHAKIKALMPERARAYWEERSLSGVRINAFTKGFYRYGLLGNLIGFLHTLARLNGIKLEELLSLESIGEQERWFDQKIAPIFDGWFVRNVATSPLALFNLGIPPHQYQALCNGEPKMMAEVLKQRARKLATVVDIKDNYFAWQGYGRRYDTRPDGSCPPYLMAQHWDALRANINNIHVQQASYRDVLMQQPPRSIDRYLLLDAQDWMSDEELLLLWNEIERTATPDARVVFRTAGEASCIEGKLSAAVALLWHRNQAVSDSLHAKDRSAIYGGLHVYERQAGLSSAFDGLPVKGVSA